MGRKWNNSKCAALMFYSPEHIIVSRETKTEIGKGTEVTVKTVTSDQYRNYIQSVPFFDSFGNGAYSRAYPDYTSAGYIPTLVKTKSPGGSICIEREFYFLSKKEYFSRVSEIVEKNGGFREREILEKSSPENMRVIEWGTGYDVLQISAEIDGEIKSFDIELNSERVTG